VFTQANLLDEMQISLRDVDRFFSIEHTHDECNQSLGDDGIAVGREVQGAVVIALGMQPYARLTTANEQVVRFLEFFYQLKVATEFDYILLLLHPVVERAELFNDFLLLAFDVHASRVMDFFNAPTKMSISSVVL
jgi:hypothetical protein